VGARAQESFKKASELSVQQLAAAQSESDRVAIESQLKVPQKGRKRAAKEP